MKHTLQIARRRMENKLSKIGLLKRAKKESLEDIQGSCKKIIVDQLV